ncbi:type II toxin-antitoxin system RelE/ParE family toxin [Pseudomonadota bacterium]
MIKSFRHKGLKRFYETGSRAGIQSSHVSRLARQLARLIFEFTHGNAFGVDYDDYH